MKKILALLLLAILVAGGAAGGVAWWARQPISLPQDAQNAPMEFSIQAGSGVRSAARQIADAGIPVQPLLLEALARATGQAPRIKAGDYELEAGSTPLTLLDKLVRGQFAQKSLAIIEGWSFRQMRAAIAAHPALKHDTVQLSDKELLAKVAPEYPHPEGLFAPDTYLFAKGASDLQIYRQAHALMQKRLLDAWEKRAANLPYRTPYEALVMASIVEKETGMKADRAMIAGVFVNRLRIGMLLQTDPTVIYGLGEKFDGNIRKRDLTTDTVYNTYTRAGLPPTPIALPGVAALQAAMNPAQTDALYFVARGDGSSHFSRSLDEHNRAVNKYLR